MSDSTPVIHPVYLPFTRQQLALHFSDDKHLDYFATSAIRYAEFVARLGAKFEGMPITNEVRLARQIEKDERFWTACTLKMVFDAGRFADILRIAFGDVPPITGFASWDQCVGDRADQELRFEVAVSSPQVYRDTLRDRYLNQGPAAHLVPYIVHAGMGRTAYEGATKVDAIFRNRKTGFSVMFEAKVLSDISCDVTFDPFRNQLARNIDVMLDTGDGFLTLDPAKRLLALLTPKVFKDRPTTRYYGLLFHQYKSDPALLSEHLAHRDAATLAQVPPRLGWLTFEECQRICPACCPWLATQGSHS
ncbi:MAG: hypothetical protein AB7O62_12505 [Pirellulales bacterium]